MNAGLFGAINGIAAAAKTAGDSNSIAVCNFMLQLASWNFGTTYDAAASQATPVISLGTNPYPAGSIAPTVDSLFALGLTDIRRVGG